MDYASDDTFNRLSVALSEAGHREKTWLAIGDALHALETRDSKTIDGRPWHDVMRSFLKEQGLSVTTGHLNKVRRVRTFVRNNIGPNVSDDRLTAPKAQFSALEMAERLHTLDHSAGVEALTECIDGLSFGKMRDRYESFRDAHPELLPPRQLAWMRKRAAQKNDFVITSSGVQNSRPPTDLAPSDAARRLSKEFVEQLWRDAYEKGWSDAVAEETRKDQVIKLQQARIADLQAKAKDAE